MSRNIASKDIRTRGIVLRRTNYGEADRILNIITAEGKVAAIAKGVRKERSKLAGGVEMFSLIDFNIHKGKSDLGVVTGAKMIKYYGGILRDFERMELAGLILKRINAAAEQTDNAEFFEITEQCMTELDNETFVALVEGWFWLNLMRATGEEVNLYRDVKGEKLQAELRYAWDVGENAFGVQEKGEYGADEIKIMRLMVSMPLKVVKKVKVEADIWGKVLDLARIMAKN